MEEATRPFDVLIVGGAAGTGKTRLSQELLRRHRTSLCEFDDVVEALKAMTTAEQQPLLHYWDTHPAAVAWSAEEIVALTARVCDVLAPAAEAVVANHLGQQLRAACELLAVPALDARPWLTLPDRVHQAIV